MIRAPFAAFELDEYRQRFDNARRAARSAGCGAAVVMAPEHLFYLGGYDSWVSVNSPQALIFTTGDDPPTLVLRDVDLASLVAGNPGRGRGTAIALSSSGWWFRGLDDIAARLAKLAGQPVLAVFEYGWGEASGFFLALPEGHHQKQIFRGISRRIWTEGGSRLVGLPLDELSLILPRLARMHRDSVVELSQWPLGRRIG